MILRKIIGKMIVLLISSYLQHFEKYRFISNHPSNKTELIMNTNDMGTAIGEEKHFFFRYCLAFMSWFNLINLVPKLFIFYIFFSKIMYSFKLALKLYHLLYFVPLSKNYSHDIVFRGLLKESKQKLINTYNYIIT